MYISDDEGFTEILISAHLHSYIKVSRCVRLQFHNSNIKLYPRSCGDIFTAKGRY